MLSIIIPTIRTEKWPALIESIKKSCTNHEYEIIFVGPYYSNVIEPYWNIKYVRDFGSPNRCQQIGLVLCEGKYVTWGSDDCFYTDGSIDICMDMLIEKDLEYLTTGYDEGGNTAVNNYSVRACYMSGRNVAPEWNIFNVAFVRRDILDRMNFDTQFEVTCIGHADLACRIQKEYLGGGLLRSSIMQCEHMPGISGDHKPVHDAQTYSDQGLFYNKYNGDFAPEIQSDEWKKSPRVWERRFTF